MVPKQVRHFISSRRATSLLIAAINGGALLLLAYCALPLLRKNSEAAQIVPTTQLKAGLDVAKLARSNAFGGSLDVQEKASGPLDDLNLVLHGIIALGAGGMALMSVNGGEAKAFRQGEEISGGSILAALYSDHAIVRRDSQVRTVMLAGPQIRWRAAEMTAPVSDKR